MHRIGWYAIALGLAIAGFTCSSEETTGTGTGTAGVGAGTSTGTGNNTGGQGNGFITGGGGHGVGAQGGCGAQCEYEEYGPGTDHPFNPTPDNSNGVGLDPEGALVLDQSLSNVPKIIWIANTSAGTVTRVDTTTYERQGRFRINAGAADPSRTSVNSLGDVFVGDRGYRRLVKISAAQDECPDTNQDGQITTSHSFDDVLAWGQDDCKIWDVAVPTTGLVRGVAAQDLVVDDPMPDDPYHKRIERYVYTGGAPDDARIFKYDADDGALLFSTASPSPVYGLALDGNGQLWMCDYFSGRFGRVDTTRCTDQASCDAAEICHTDCDSGGNCACRAGCSTSCADAIKEEVHLFGQTTGSVYGITVDYKQRVWLGGSQVKRYDPYAAVEPRLVYAATNFVHGVAADGEGWVWGADGSSSVWRMRGDNPAEILQISGVPSKGMAVDGDGKIWTINYTAGASVIVPGPSNTLGDYQSLVPAGNLPELGSPMCPNGQCYTYSDMTGQQLALATNDPGYYYEVFDGCAEGDTSWLVLDWEVETPAGTFVAFRARTAASIADLATAVWVLMGKDPPDSPPVDMATKFSNQGITPGRYLELEVELQGVVNLDQFQSPRVLSFSATHTCSNVPQ